jgi:hypothetical protein
LGSLGFNCSLRSLISVSVTQSVTRGAGFGILGYDSNVQNNSSGILGTAGACVMGSPPSVGIGRGRSMPSNGDSRDSVCGALDAVRLDGGSITTCVDGISDGGAASMCVPSMAI